MPNREQNLRVLLVEFVNALGGERCGERLPACNPQPQQRNRQNPRDALHEVPL